MHIVAHSASAFDHQRDEYLNSGFDDFLAKPVTWQSLEACLRRVPGLSLPVPPEPPPASAPVAARGPAVPEPLRARLIEAARLHSATELRRGLRELERLTPEVSPLAREITQALRRYDMEAVLSALGETAPARTRAHRRGGTAMRERILVVDDVPGNIDVLGAFLEPAGFEVLAAASGEKALGLGSRARPALILLDVVMPGWDGFETCRRLKAQADTADVPVVFITARDDPSSLMAGFRAGGVDYVTKPFNRDEVLMRVKTHVDLYRSRRDLTAQATALTEANRRLREEIERRERAERAFAEADDRLSLLSEQEATRWGLEGFVGRSPTMAGILQEVRRLQDFPSTGVLITGESGTGKELVARALHFGSPRAGRAVHRRQLLGGPGGARRVAVLRPPAGRLLGRQPRPQGLLRAGRRRHHLPRRGRRHAARRCRRSSCACSRAAATCRSAPSARCGSTCGW